MNGINEAVTTYGWNMGDWYVWGGFRNVPNRAAFGPNLSRSTASFLDGLSSTVMASKVRSHQSEQVNCAGLSSVDHSRRPAAQLGTGHRGPQSGGGRRLHSIERGSHIMGRWVASTRAASPRHWTPNTVDLDVVGTPEISGGPTYAAITSRSYHPGGVNALFGDGSVHFIKETINLNSLARLWVQ